MTPARRLGFAFVVLVPSCSHFEGARRTAPVGEYLEGVAANLRAGDLDRAEDILRRARSRFPDDGGVRATEALLAQMQGRDEDAERELQALTALPGRGGLSDEELRQRIGDLLFRAGRYRESMPYLASAPSGVEGDVRRAFARLAPRLPATRVPLRATAVEVPLLEGAPPKLVVTVGGKERALGIDTGASFTTLGRSLAVETGVTGLEPAGRALDGASQSFAIAAGVLPSVTLGELDLGPMPVLVVDDARLRLRDLEGGATATPPGILGQDVLLRLRITIDGIRRSVVFEPRRSAPDRDTIQCVWHEGCLLVPMRAEGQTLWMVLDTGASASSLTDEGLAILPGSERRAVPGYAKVRGPGGTRLATRVVKDLAVTLGAVRFSCGELPVVERGPRGVFPVHGVLGADLLMRCRLTIDRGRVKVSV